MDRNEVLKYLTEKEAEQPKRDAEYVPELGLAEALRRKALQGATFNQADEVGGALYALWDIATDKQNTLSDFGNLRKNYTAQIREVDEQASREHPGLGTVAEIAGSAMSGGALLKGAQALKNAGKAASMANKPLGKWGTRSILGAEGATTGIGQSEDLDNSIEDATTGAAYNLVGAKIGDKVGQVAGAGFRKAKRAAEDTFESARKFARKALGMTSPSKKDAIISSLNTFGIEATDKSVDDMADEFVSKAEVIMDDGSVQKIVQRGDDINTINTKFEKFNEQNTEKLKQLVKEVSKREGNSLSLSGIVENVEKRALDTLRGSDGSFKEGTEAAQREIASAMKNAKKHITDADYLDYQKAGKQLDYQLGTKQVPKDGKGNFQQLWDIRHELGQKISNNRSSGQNVEALNDAYKYVNEEMYQLLKKNPDEFAKWSDLNRMSHLGLTFAEPAKEAAKQYNNSISNIIRSSDFSLLRFPAQVAGLAVTRGTMHKYGYGMMSEVMDSLHKGLAKTGTFVNSAGRKIPDRFVKELKRAREVSGPEGMTRAAIKLWGTEPEFRQQYSNVYEAWTQKLVDDVSGSAKRKSTGGIRE